MAEERVQRRLAAILAADVVGYSRLMGGDEEGTLSRMKTLLSDVIEPKINEYSGRIFKTTGDGFLADFSSAVDAVRLAIDVQRAMAGHNTDIPEDSRIVFRIGISLGDVMIDGDDLFGNGVNIAARMEGLADPGGICVSGNVQEHIGNALDVSVEDIGEQSVKNIDRPVRCYRVHLESDRPTDDFAQRPEELPSIPDKPSIAVLPFQNMSGDPDQEYFSDGITGDIITALSHIRWFFVVARNSSFSYKGTSPNIRKVANELGVRYVLEGSVRKVGNRVRISAQLIDGSSGNHLWAERYDRELEDIFAVQDEITRTVVGAIGPEMADAEIDKAQRSPPNDLDAWDCYLRGMWHFYSRTPDDFDRAIELFDRAVALDPTLAVAYAAGAQTHYFQTTGVGNMTIGSHPEDGLRMANKAVELDDEDADARVALGLIHLARGEFEQAKLQLEKAVDLNPSDGQAIRWLGTAYSWSGEPETAILLFETSLRVSPRDPLVGSTMVRMAECHHFLKDYENAVTWARKALREPTTRYMGHITLISALAHLGRIEESQKALTELIRLLPEFTRKRELRAGGAMVHWPKNYISGYMEGLRKAGLPE